MPIEGLTAGLEHEMPRLGVLRKGAKRKKVYSKKYKKDVWVPGEDLTYFRFVTQSPEVEQVFYDAYGKEPRTINCRLAFPDLANNFPTWNEEQGAGSLKHRCNGKVMILWQDEDHLYHTKPKPCPYADFPKGDPRRKCSQQGLLRIIIPELMEWGYIEAITGGKWDCIGLTKNVLEIEHIASVASQITGRPIGVQGVDCQLRREPRMTSCPNFDGEGKKIRQEKWMLYLYVHPTYLARLSEEMKRYSLPVVDLPRLAEPETEIEVDYYVGNGDDVEHVETEIVDEPAPASDDGYVPARPDELLTYVNQNISHPYDDLKVLRVALEENGVSGFWPSDKPKDREWWREAKDIAINIRADAQPELPLDEAA